MCAYLNVFFAHSNVILFACTGIKLLGTDCFCNDIPLFRKEWSIAASMGGIHGIEIVDFVDLEIVDLIVDLLVSTLIVDIVLF